ncbi:LON peptidase substrate-binding domain-containing protein [Desertibaculum subflavum]|uniref:LON peptidase substrate-binding domain-containing protein n=1 Tax=Desertibaculum subflavum TaxID=2268458 RepID=UPI000E674FB3
MSRDTRIPGFEELPRALPIFPLAGALLLPSAPLPLNIFEPRYLAMTRDVLGSHRLIGMVQPTDPAAEGKHPETYRIGCVGKVVRFEETNDNRFLIMLLGVVRFEVIEELDVTTPYRQVVASYGSFRGDLTDEDPTAEKVDRAGFIAAFKSYSDRLGLKANWDEVDKAPVAPLVNALAVACPFEPSEKQALLEARDLAARAEAMLVMMRMADGPHQPGGKRPTLQ